MSAAPAASAKHYRNAFLSYEDICKQLNEWVSAHPSHARIEWIGKTPEGRDIPLLVVGRDPDRRRPAVWIDGNMHATELAGTNVALSIADSALEIHLTGKYAGLSDTLAGVLQDVLFYVVPRMSPDGAESVLMARGYVRSAPRDTRPNAGRTRWVQGDIDGDGRVVMLRKRDPAGELVESKTVPGMLVPRTVDDPPPYYRVFPEGTIENFDGHTIPSPNFLGDNEYDFNRNFPYFWAPDHEQVGAGAYPMSAPETRAVVEWSAAHPEIFAWLNLHTYGGCYIRPSGDQPDDKMNQSDLALYRQVAAWNEEFTSYPTVSSYEEFTYEPGKPLRGDLTDYAYVQRGALAYVCELWDLFKRLDIPRPKRFVDYYAKFSNEDAARLYAWDRDHNKSRIFVAWRPFKHPQLGDVEIGGIDTRFGLSNPPPEQLDQLCTAHTAAFLRVAALAPRIAVASTVQQPADGANVRRVTLRVQNLGYLPTYILDSASKLSWNEPLYLDVVESKGVELLAPSPRVNVGHLEGWGRGVGEGHGSPLWLYTRGNSSEKNVEIAVTVKPGTTGLLRVRVGSCRVGFVDTAIEIS